MLKTDIGTIDAYLKVTLIGFYTEYAYLLVNP